MGAELSITCWERTYRRVLDPGFVAGIAEMSADPFDERVVVVNNVDDERDAVDRANALVQSGEISRYRLVSQDLDRALAITGLTRRSLDPIPHYTDHLLVAAVGDGPEYLCHWDADVRLLEPADWVTPSLAYLEEHPEALSAMPAWSHAESLDAERVATVGPFDLGYGFSDHVFLVRRSRIARPVYRYVAPASWWFPTSHLAPIFEQRIDAYMRRHRLHRAVYRAATYFHDGPMLAQAGGGWRRAKRKARTLTGRALERWAPRHPALVHVPARL